MLAVGTKVQVKPHQRVRTIWNNAEHTPGKAYDMPGYEGEIVKVFDDTGEITYEIHSRRYFWETESYEDSYQEHAANEVEPL